MTVCIHIWSTSGLNLFHLAFPHNFLEYAAIVVYDITQRHSFEVAKKLVDEFAQCARRGAFVALVGNKADLESSRKVSFKVSNVVMFIWCHSATHEITQDRRFYLMVFVENDANNVLERMATWSGLWKLSGRFWYDFLLCTRYKIILGFFLVGLHLREKNASLVSAYIHVSFCINFLIRYMKKLFSIYWLR